MLVLLVRHGEAVPASASGTDGLRGLTEAGRAGLRHLADRLAESGRLPRWIYTSPLVRAVQSAEVLAAGAWYRAALEVPVQVAVELAPDEGSSAELLDRILAAPEGPVALVGHEPNVRILAAHLLGEGALPPFGQGEAWVLKLSPGGDVATLLERVPPT